MRRSLLPLVCALAGLCGCEDTPAPVGPPRCEPPEELVLERGLKTGFRALSEDDRPAARVAFEAVLTREPEHPEALAGLRAVQRAAPRRAAPRLDSGGFIEVAGERRAVGLPVQTERYRFEEMRAQARLARELGLEVSNRAIHSYFQPRSGDGAEPIELRDVAAVEERIDLVVLHDSRTQTARESFLQLRDQGGSTHFTIDYDGTVFQNLDVGWEANHSGRAPVDARSVSVDLVNPATTDRPPLPEDSLLDRHARPLGDFAEIHGREVQHWGYTSPQLESLYRLLRELARLLPEVPAEVVGGGRAPRARVEQLEPGVVGHLHVSPRAEDPGSAFDWAALATALRR